MTFLRNTILIVFITVLAGSAAMAGISGTFVKADASNTSPADCILLCFWKQQDQNQWHRRATSAS